MYKKQQKDELYQPQGEARARVGCQPGGLAGCPGWPPPFGDPAPSPAGAVPTLTRVPSWTIEPHTTHLDLPPACAVSRPPQFGQGSSSGFDHTAKSQSGYRLQL